MTGILNAIVYEYVTIAGGGIGQLKNGWPPNASTGLDMLKEGEQQILVEGGRLIFGPDIGTCRTKTKKNVSITDIKSKLAQKNIFKR